MIGKNFLKIFPGYIPFFYTINFLYFFPPYIFLSSQIINDHFCFQLMWVTGMILRNHTYLKAYKCWRILPILKMPTIKWLEIFFKKYFNFQGFYIVYIIIWWFLGWKNFTPSKLGKTGFQKMHMAHLFLEKNMEK